MVRFDTRDTSSLESLAAITDDLMANIKLNSEIKRQGNLMIQQTFPRSSKHIINEIDAVLAQHYGFTDEDLDFIVNYDIKYRMGIG